MTYYKATNNHFDWIEEHKFNEKHNKYEIQVMLISKTGGIYSDEIHSSKNYVDTLMEQGYELDDILHSFISYPIEITLFNAFMDHKGYDEDEKIFKDIHDEIMNISYISQNQIQIPHTCTEIAVRYNFSEDCQYEKI